jgi:hypothetical protein
VGTLDINLGVYFELSFVMAEVGNLHVKLGLLHIFFIMAVVGNILITRTDPIAIIVPLHVRRAPPTADSLPCRP